MRTLAFQLRLLPATPTKQPYRAPPPKAASLLFRPFAPHYKYGIIPKPNSLFNSESRTRHLSFRYSYASASSTTIDDDFDVELGRLLALLPDEMHRKVREHPEWRHLIEIVMDLGRKPLARFPSGDFVLSDQPITFSDLEHATSQVGDFAADNRAGISRTLHRISAIRNRKGVIIGLTCRVGRAISGSGNLLRDLVKDGGSLLLIGPPGVGKTTIIREIARTLADDCKKRVMIVDTSNEIGGDGDIPHEGIGAARRMQVSNSDMQHKVLIEAVENHMPQVIVIDEIGTKLEAMAASTIAQRGLQLVATAHGVTIENLIMNPSLEMLVGGIQSVTLGDEEASRRGVQKTVLERRGPSTFTCAVEMVSKTELRVHRSLEATVDALLSGQSPNFEVRKINSQGFSEEMVAVQIETSGDISSNEHNEIMVGDLLEKTAERVSSSEFTSEVIANREEISSGSSKDEVSHRLFIYGILETSVLQAIKQLRMDDAVELTDNISEADALLALNSRLKKNSRIQALAKSRDIPVYVTKTSSLLLIMKAIRSFVGRRADGFNHLEVEDRISSSEKIDALEEARLAIEQIVIPKGEPAKLLPRSPAIMSLQMDLIKKYQLQSEKVGEEPNTQICILPHGPVRMERTAFDDGIVDLGDNSNNLSGSGDTNGSFNSMTRLPLLPD